MFANATIVQRKDDDSKILESTAKVDIPSALHHHWSCCYFYYTVEIVLSVAVSAIIQHFRTILILLFLKYETNISVKCYIFLFPQCYEINVSYYYSCNAVKITVCNVLLRMRQSHRAMMIILKY